MQTLPQSSMLWPLVNVEVELINDNWQSMAYRNVLTCRCWLDQFISWHWSWIRNNILSFDPGPGHFSFGLPWLEWTLELALPCPEHWIKRISMKQISTENILELPWDGHVGEMYQLLSSTYSRSSVSLRGHTQKKVICVYWALTQALAFHRSQSPPWEDHERLSNEKYEAACISS